MNNNNYRYVFQSEADFPALERLGQRLHDPYFSKWALEVPWAKKLPGAPDHDDFPVRRRRILLYDGEEVRASQNFFEHELYLHGVPHPFVWSNGQLSESIVDKKYRLCWPSVAEYSLQLQPFQMLLGGTPDLRRTLFKFFKWTHVNVPLLVLPVKGDKVLLQARRFRKFRSLKYLLTPFGLRWAAKLACFATSGIKRKLRSVNLPEFEEVDSFGEWADLVWRDSVGKYAAVTRRDAATLNRLFKAGDKRFHMVRIRRQGRDLGWFIYTTTLRDDLDFGFGDLRVAAIVDAFGAPEHALEIMKVGVKLMVAEDVDLIFGYVSHESWQKAFLDLGFFRKPGKELSVSPGGQQLVFTADCPIEKTYFTNGDCNGPYYVAYEQEGAGVNETKSVNCPECVNQ